MKLKKLIKDIPFSQVKGSKDIDITGISCHSKTVAPGNIFIARKGLVSDGSQFIEEAIDHGAVAVLSDIYNPFIKNITQLIHPDPLEACAQLAGLYYDHPSHHMQLFGVTGTNGKTTLSYMIKTLLQESWGLCGLMGTVEYQTGNHHYNAPHTTPDITLIQKYLKEMQLHECRACVMEVSSHALDQRRVEGLAFDSALFTNLSHEHLDYHLDMESYYQAKKKLFTLLSPSSQIQACINADDPYGQRLLKELEYPCLGYGFQKGEVRAKDVELSDKGSIFTLCYQEKSWQVKSPLVGRFNIYNLLAMFAFGFSKDISIKCMLKVANNFAMQHGRLERIDNPLKIKVYVDYAHTPDALENVLKTLKEISKGRVVVVFGCGGDRDKEKRPLMGRVAGKYATHCVITSDNPRSESPNQIIQDILKGMNLRDQVFVQEDRKEAIIKGLLLCQHEDDILLVAGKGHESRQVFSCHTQPFDDREMIQLAAQSLMSKELA